MKVWKARAAGSWQQNSLIPQFFLHFFNDIFTPNWGTVVFALTSNIDTWMLYDIQWYPKYNKDVSQLYKRKQINWSTILVWQWFRHNRSKQQYANGVKDKTISLMNRLSGITCNFSTYLGIRLHNAVRKQDDFNGIYNY